jgi:hypothetical protein
MQQAVERVMQTYGLLVSLTPVQEREAREKVSTYLKGKGNDVHKLAVEGLKHLWVARTGAADVQLHFRTASSNCCGS